MFAHVPQMSKITKLLNIKKKELFDLPKHINKIAQLLNITKHQ